MSDPPTEFDQQDPWTVTRCYRIASIRNWTIAETWKKVIVLATLIGETPITSAKCIFEALEEMIDRGQLPDPRAIRNKPRTI